MEHCDKGPLIDQLKEDNKETHQKLDKIYDVLSAVAVQKERVDTLGKKTEDLEKRVRKIEGSPLRVLKWLGGIGASLVTAYLIYRLGLKG